MGCSPADESANDDTSLNGTFNTPIISGITYQTDTQSGTTDANGSFKYAEGEIIRFYLGDTFLGETYAKPSITPVDLEQSVTTTRIATRASNINANWTINLFNLLKNIDNNNDMSDGIQITQSVRNAAVSFSMQLDLTPTDFNNHANTQSFTTSINITLDQPTQVSIYIRSNYQNSSNWGSLIWGSSNWSN